MECSTPRDFLKSQSGGKHTNLHPPQDILILLARKKDLTVYELQKKIEVKFPGYLRELYQHAVRVHTNEALFQYIMDAMMETLIATLCR